MADKPYTDADVEALAAELLLSQFTSTEFGEMVWRDSAESERGKWRGLARVAFDALAVAGRLLPEGASPAECGCPITVEAATITRHTRECRNKEADARLAAHIADEYGSTDE
jgi:hypothetical protein